MTAIQPRHTEVTRDRRGNEYITYEPHAGRVKGRVAGKVVVDSDRAMVLREGRRDPVLYFPMDDVRMDLLTLNDHTSYCPYRGVPVYFDLAVDGRVVGSIGWSYRDPHPDSAYVKDYIAFYRDLFDSWEESASLPADPPHVDEPNPLADWLVRDGWRASSLSDLVTRWLGALQGAGIPVLRISLVTRTLHPLLSGAVFRWQRGEGGVEHIEIAHEVLTTTQYLESPLVPIFEGAGGVRRRLESGADDDDYPILAELRAAGGSDYVAMPVVFSDGQINALTMASDRPGGFTTRQLGIINEVLPLVGRLVEVFIQREKAETLLTTYLGRETGRRVLEGRVRRGDGEDIHAVIWFSDLRGSSTLADALSREDFLELLNGFFDCMAGAVLDHGGEVLRFIGDAALAIFAIEPGEREEAPACRRALAAASDAVERIEAYNRDNSGRWKTTVTFGIGLHIGDVTYGNIGTQSRLEFTVIGAAANEAARIEGLCKSLEQPVLLSEDFAVVCPGDYASLGYHHLAGTGRHKEIFAPPRHTREKTADGGADRG